MGKDVMQTDTTRNQRRILKGEKEYPVQLTHFPDMPAELYVDGNLPDPQKPAVAIVGSRMCSTYGRLQAFRFARTLSENGVQVISGLALGIDSEAHSGALAGGTPTFAILGCGLDIPYPRGNQMLRRKILERAGGIITEYPAGSPAMAYHFPIRNRIISALSDLVLVVEARKKSGSLITASYALDQGKPVYAIPGEIHEALAEGTNRLIFDGAGPAIDPDVILTELGIVSKKTLKHMGKAENGCQSAEDMRKRMQGPELTPEEKSIVNCIGEKAKNANQISRELEMPVSMVNGYLARLEISGVVVRAGGGAYAVR